MPRPFSRLLTALLFVSLPIATALTFAQGQAAPSGLDLGAINRSVDPCSDFYMFACGEWLAKNSIPMDEADIERNGIAPLDARLRQVDALRDVAALPVLAADLHAAGVNVFFSFGSEADAKDARTNIASVGQAGFGLPDRDYYFRDDQRSVDLMTTVELQALTPAFDTYRTRSGTPTDGATPARCASYAAMRSATVSGRMRSRSVET